MFKFLLIFSLVIYSVYKIGNMFFRAGAASQQLRNPPPRQNTAPTPKKDKRKGSINGGEYVDYEEVK